MAILKTHHSAQNTDNKYAQTIPLEYNTPWDIVMTSFANKIDASKSQGAV